MQSLKALQNVVDTMLRLPHGGVVIVYEDFATGLKAKQLFDQLIMPRDARSKHFFKMWDFSGLRVDSLRSRAVEDAAAADVVCLSLRGKAELPATVKEWAERWRKLRAAHRCTVVVLLEPVDDLFADDSATIGFLRNVAHNANADFLATRTEVLAEQENSFAREPLNCV